MPSFEHKPAVDPFATATSPASITSTSDPAAATAAAVLAAHGGLGTDERALSDQGSRDALVELAIHDAKTPADRATIAQWQRELDGRNPAAMQGALAQLHTDASADGVVTPSESAALTEWGAEAGRMSFKNTFDAANADNNAAAANAKARKKDPSIAKKAPSAALSTDIQGVMAAADAARVGANPELQSQRDAFEMAVALSPEANEAIAPTLDMMTAKTLAYMRAMHGDGAGGVDADQIAKLGEQPTDRKYAGAVGTDYQTLMTVLGGGVDADGKALPRGNTREVMVALSEFQDKILGPDVLADGGLERMQAVFGEGGAGAGGAFGAQDIERLQQRHAEYMAELRPGAEADAKGLWTPHGGATGPHAEYLAAKAQNMDTKLPSFSREAIAAQMGPAVAGELRAGDGASGSGEGSIFSRTQLTVDSANAAGFDLSRREEAVSGGGRLPWNTGSRANMVDPTKPFIADAASESMPLKAGISGTTARGMGLFEAFGARPDMARLAHHSQLNQIQAHSYHEIASAAEGFMGTDGRHGYDVASPYSTMGLTTDQMRTIAARAGVSFDAINSNA